MAILPIRIYPDPVLRVRCPEIVIFDQDLACLAENMIDTMYAAPGIGLAGPQVGVESRLAVVDITVGEDPDGLQILVNPEIVESEGKDLDEEGCLSIPGVTEKVMRPYRIRARAQDLKGSWFELEAEELLARAICHEIDHLDGVLFVDRLSGLRRENVKRQMRRMAREQEVQA